MFKVEWRETPESDPIQAHQWVPFVHTFEFESTAEEFIDDQKADDAFHELAQTFEYQIVPS